MRVLLGLAVLTLVAACSGDHSGGQECTITGTFVEAGQSFLICAEGDVQIDDRDPVTTTTTNRAD